ncbi:hypothetical protein [Spongiivirga citrea]|uniref:Lipoprotein n=1 Tax=Spongiivirga citrea TaxID=1481457 RepID=A0A6M0CL13_9FLAO|nr:hypothetical protein [Spongiivirga citrea]NER16539.1 hypothetical protein [Spongiivirga citrea]
MYRLVKSTNFLRQSVYLLLLLFVLQSCKETNSNNGDIGITSYTSKKTKADKKKYYDSNNNVVYEVKYKNDAFKLRTVASTLLWKVKLYDDKVKISDNEENLNGYQIKVKGPLEAKLERNNENLARIGFDESSQTITINPASGEKITKASDYSPSWLVLSIDEIPKDQQEIIISELIEKGF